ncbi:MAG: hypothetical protein SNJ78_11070, partial [Spirochaetales bacterium]
CIGLIFGTLVFCYTASACQISYTLVDSRGNAQPIVPGKTIQITKGETYSIRLDFDEDHRNCKLPPDQTEFLLNDRLWEFGKTNLPLELLSPVQWQVLSSRSNLGIIEFKAVQSGTFRLEVIRDCSKEGYEQELRIQVT